MCLGLKQKLHEKPLVTASKSILIVFSKKEDCITRTNKFNENGKFRQLRRGLTAKFH